MRTKLAYLVTGLGVFLIVVALLAQTYAPSHLKKTPIDADTVTDLSGSAILNGPTGFEEFPVLAFRTDHSDSKKSDGDVVVFQTSSCVVRDEGGIDGCVSNDDPQQRLITASTDTFAADRKTGLAVNNAKYLPAGFLPHAGLNNKWPFDAQKKTYPYWDDTIDKAVPAEFSRTDEIDGTEVYVYSVEIDRAPVDIAEGVPGFYSNSEEVSVEPRTGAIVRDVRKVAQITADDRPVLNLKLAYTPDEVNESLGDAVDAADMLHMLTVTVPIIGYVGGGLLIVLGLLLLLLGGGGSPETTGARRRDPEKVLA